MWDRVFMDLFNEYIGMVVNVLEKGTRYIITKTYEIIYQSFVFALIITGICMVAGFILTVGIFLQAYTGALDFIVESIKITNNIGAIQ